MMTLAVKWGYRAGCSPDHPVKGVLRDPESPRERHFTEKELALILDAIDSLRSRRAVLAFHMHCETGASSGEVMTAHLGAVRLAGRQADLDRGVDRNKDRKTDRPCALPGTRKPPRHLEAALPWLAAEGQRPKMAISQAP